MVALTFISRETILEALHQFVRQRYPHYIGKEKLGVVHPSCIEDDIGKLVCLCVGIKAHRSMFPFTACEKRDAFSTLMMMHSSVF